MTAKQRLGSRFWMNTRLVVLASAFYLTTLSTSIHSTPLMLVTGDWPPYINARAPDQGVMSDIVIKAFANVGYHAIIEYKPWKRVERDVNETNAISFGWSSGPERPKKWHYSSPILNGQDILVARKDAHIHWKYYRDLKPYHIGIVRGYSLPDSIKQLKPQLKLQTGYSDEANLKKLLLNRLDMVIINPLVATKLLQQKFSVQDKLSLHFYLDTPLESYSLHLICAKSFAGCAEVVLKFNQGLSVLTRDGTTQQLLDNVHSWNDEQ